MPEPTSRPGADEAWDELLRRLRQLPAGQPQPFFYERVRARLVAQAQPSPLRLPAWLRRPAYALLLGALVLAVSSDGAATAAGRRPAPLVRATLP